MIGTIITHYKILSTLGVGGMGVVYRAEDLRLKRTVALKFLPPDLTRDEEAKQRFIHEAQAASALQHNNICAVHDIDQTEDGQLFMVMDCYEGESLKQKISRGPMSVEEVLQLAGQIATGLGRAHEKGIIHRDVKPANIILTRDGVAKIVDFGLAKLAGRSILTKSSSTLGTVAYMSPEQVEGDEVDHRTDVWSLGVVLYEMLTGKLPFRGDHEAAQMYAAVHEDPIPVRQWFPTIPPFLEAVVLRCLKKNRDDRFQTMEELTAALEDLVVRQVRPAQRRKTFSRVRWIVGGLFILVAAALVYFAISFEEQASQRTSIAVLPFKNLSDDKEDEYFSDGMTEEIISRLSKIRGLKVTSRTSIEQYKNIKRSLREIAHELGVGVILEGSVRRAGGRVRITGQLIDASTDEHLWTETYDRELKDVFAIQVDVADKIATALSTTLSPEEHSRLKANRTENLEAHDLYLRGRYQWRKRTTDGLLRAANLFHQAVDKDPEYALAFVGLADCYALFPFFDVTTVSQSEAFERAKRYARTSLQFDPNLAEAHASLGNALKEGDWDWSGAEKEFQLAIALDPDYATAHQWYSECLAVAGRLDESLSEAKQSADLEPYLPVAQACLAHAYFRLKKYEDALTQYDRVAEMDSTRWTPYRNLARFYLSTSQPDLALGPLERAGAPRWLVDFCAPTTSAARRTTISSSGATPPVPWGCFYAEALAHFGFHEQALDLLNRLAEGRNAELPYIIEMPTLDPVRADRRFGRVLQLMGLKK